MELWLFYFLGGISKPFLVYIVYIVYISIMKTTTLNDIEKITDGNVSPEHWYQWGNEPTGYVSVGAYVDDVWYGMGVVRKDEAIQSGLTFHNPHA